MKKKPPTAIILGNEAHQPAETAAGRRGAALGFGGLGAFGGGGGGGLSGPLAAARTARSTSTNAVIVRHHSSRPSSSSKQRSRDRSWVTSDRYLSESLTLPVLLRTSVS